MYVDDTSISFAAPTNYDLEIMINTELANVNSSLKANKLSLNVTKTEFLIFGFRQRLQTQTEVSIRAHIEGKEVKSWLLKVSWTNNWQDTLLMQVYQ